VLTHVHPGVDADQAREATGWELKVADELVTTDPPTDEELRQLRELVASEAVTTPPRSGDTATAAGEAE
jgi:hypothetical protein